MALVRVHQLEDDEVNQRDVYEVNEDGEGVPSDWVESEERVGDAQVNEEDRAVEVGPDLGVAPDVLREVVGKIAPRADGWVLSDLASVVVDEGEVERPEINDGGDQDKEEESPMR